MFCEIALIFRPNLNRKVWRERKEDDREFVIAKQTEDFPSMKRAGGFKATREKKAPLPNICPSLITQIFS